MRLLIDARTGWGHGIGRVISCTVPLVARLRPDWQIEALVQPPHREAADKTFRKNANVVVRSCPIAPFSFGEQIRLQPYAKHSDLTWFTNYWVPLSWRSPFAVTVHDMLHLLPEMIPASPVKRLLSRMTFAKVRREARAIMFDSRFSQREFRRLVGEPEHTGMTVTLGGDHLEYPEPRRMADRERRLLVVAASKKHKNFALLFEAWRRARVPEPWTLTVVSPREMLLNAVDIAELAGQNSRIDIRRSISNEELAGLYARSAIVLMPSLYEGFGLPLIEGMLAGALCVSSNAGALTEVAQGGFVQFVNGDDLPGWTAAIEQVCAMIDKGSLGLDPLLGYNVETMRRYRWEDTARKVVKVLEEAVG